MLATSPLAYPRVAGLFSTHPLQSIIINYKLNTKWLKAILAITSATPDGAYRSQRKEFFAKKAVTQMKLKHRK